MIIKFKNGSVINIVDNKISNIRSKIKIPIIKGINKK